MLKVASIPALVAVISGLAAAQGVHTDVDAKSSSKKVISITTSENGKQRTYRKVIQDGKVIEESGDPRLLEDKGLNLRGLLRKARRDGDVKTKRSGRRIVVRDGKKVIDERTGDGEDFDLDFDVDVDVKKSIRDALKKVEQLHRKHGKHEGLRIEVLPEFLKDMEVDLKGAVRKGLRSLRDLHVEIPDFDVDFDRIIDEIHRHIPDIHESWPDVRHRIRSVERDKTDTGDLEHQIQDLMRQAQDLQRELDNLMRNETRTLRRSHRSRL